MSFWRTFGFHTISPIENILDRENFGLEELLDEDDILQETKAQNKKLLDYLAKPETLQHLFNFVLVEADENAEAKRRFKYPFVCSEILCADVWSLGEVIFEQEALVPSLLAFFDRDARLNPVTTGHVCKVVASLLQRKTAEMLAYMKKKEDLIGKLLNHLDSGAVMDLLLKVISCEDPASNSGNSAPIASATLQWLADSALIPRLVARLDISAPADLQDNVSCSLIDIVNASSSLPNSPLMAQLHSEEVFNKLLAYSLAEHNTHYGLNLIVELLNRAAQDSHNATAQLTDLPPYIRVLLSALDKYKALLVPPADAKTVTFSFGAIVPLGFVRLKVVELIAALLRLNYRCVSTALAGLNAPAAVFDLFFQYKWHNFLHATVRSLVCNILASDDHDLKMHLVQGCKLGQRIIETVKANAEEEAKPKGVRSGLMGFVIGIASDLANAAHNNAALATALKEGGLAWQVFEDGALKELKNAEDEPLGGSKPAMQDAPDDEPESGEIVLKYLVQQGFSTKGMSFAQEVTEEDDDDDEDDDDHNRVAASDEYLASAMYQTEPANRGGRDGSGSSSDEDDDDDDEDGDQQRQP